VMSAAGFSGMQPALEVIEVPWAEPEHETKYYVWQTPRVRIRRVRAAKVASLASQLGAWAVVLSATSRDAQRAQRALMHELSGLAPGVFAVHALADDLEAKACRSLYEFLARPCAAQGVEPAVPDSPFLSMQCHPSRLEPVPAMVAIERAFGDEFIKASKRVQAAMEQHEATPAWLAVMQRQIEQSASALLASSAVTERDKAVQSGVAAALTAAMQVIAQNTEPGEGSEP
jgi:hypothetical protein